jgi:GTP-binding protein HflX
MPADSERAILVGLDLKGSAAMRGSRAADAPEITSEESIEELEVLASSAGAEVVSKTIQSRDAVESATLIGSGKVNELALEVKSLRADVIIFDRDLSPTQQRNLERSFDCKVVDRTQLILDIFARRARTREGQLQVELAQLNYLLPRLAGRGTQMSRLGGGIGTRGPGETQLETDRRRIFRRIRKIEEDLESVRAGRAVQRRQRQAVPLATVGLVGYTNAGKSTLFNRLTRAGVLADAKMFATLDPTVRQLTLPSNRRVLLSDTVGFISNLPTTLVKAFRATLEEVTEAAILLHVVDVSSPHAAQHTAHVLRVLGDIGATETKQVLAMNKIDRLSEGELDADMLRHRVLGSAGGGDAPTTAVAVSAKTGAGVDRLLNEVDRLLPLDPLSVTTFRIPHTDGAALHMLYEYARVVEKRFVEEYSEIVAETPESVKKRLSRFIYGTPESASKP